MNQEKIIEFLKAKTDYASGEEISHRLGISRQALWKHIQDLKSSGYDIQAVPHLGYRLAGVPDRLFPSEVAAGLATEYIGKKIYYFDEVSSTMDNAFRLGTEGAPDGTLVIAEGQSKGRGRLGREWSSPKYKGIYASVILRPKIAPQQAPICTLLAAVSISAAIRSLTRLEVQIKWPNDILLHNKKVGGILTELNAEMDAIRFIVIGMGLNVNNDKKTLVAQAASLKEYTKDAVSRVELLQEIARTLEEGYLVFQKEGGDSILERWRAYNSTLGKRVKVVSHKEHIEAEAVDIDSDGGLIIRKDSGVMQKITAGDIVHCH